MNVFHNEYFCLNFVSVFFVTNFVKLIFSLQKLKLGTFFVTLDNVLISYNEKIQKMNFLNIQPVQWSGFLSPRI